MCSAKLRLLNLGFQPNPVVRRSSGPTRLTTSAVFCSFNTPSSLRLSKFDVRNDEWKPYPGRVAVAAMDEDSVDFSSFEERMDNDVFSTDNSRILSSSEGEDSDSEVFVLPATEGDLPHSSKKSNYSYPLDLSMTGHHLGAFRRNRRRQRMQPGAVLNMGLITFLTVIVLLVDSCLWRIVRLPLPPFYMTQPFFTSAVLASISGYVFLPILGSFKFHQVIRSEGPASHYSKGGTPTMGGLFFLPVGITVAISLASSSVEVYGAAGATLSFAAIGFLDDFLSLIKNHNYGLPGWIKLSLQVAVGILFVYWLNSRDISSPYSMKFLVPFPAPLGLVYLGKLYFPFSAFCFASMGNGVNLTDGLDGLAGGAAACAFIGMSVAVLPICPDLAVFGASMAGSCIGFLIHNRHKASIFMGDTGSLALGGALAAMAACTGMFFPLLIASGVFVIEAVSVIIQVSFKKATEKLYGKRKGFFRMAPFHHHLELSGVEEPVIVGGAYIVSLLLSILAAYIGLISA